MPRRLGEDRPPRAVRGGGRYTSQLLVGLCTHATVVGRTLLHIGQVEGADAGAMADPAIDIKLVGTLPVFVCLVDRDFGLMLVLMMPHVLHLGCRAFVLAIGSNRRPAELER